MPIVSIHFFPIGSRISKYALKPGTYKKGTAKLTPNSGQLVNRLWVKGGKALSDVYSQAITVGTDPIPLHYPPRAPVTVAIGGESKTLGIQNIHEVGSHDFLLNAAEKLLIPDLCTSGTGTISYRYEYPIKILLEEPTSQTQYGVFEDILRVDTNDKEMALELGLRHLYKYSQPVISGGIEPFEGVYKPGEYILTQIPDLNIDCYLEIKEVTYDSIPGQARVDIKLQLESPDRDVSHILKDLSQRLFALEKAALKDDEGPVEYYIAREEPWAWLEANEVPPPIEAVGWWQWQEQTGRVTPVATDEEVIWRETIAAIPPVEMSEEMNWVDMIRVDTEIFTKETHTWQELMKIAVDIDVVEEEMSWGERMVVENEIEVSSENSQWVESIEIELDFGVFPSETLYPSTTLYPKEWS